MSLTWPIVRVLKALWTRVLDLLYPLSVLRRRLEARIGLAASSSSPMTTRAN